MSRGRVLCITYCLVAVLALFTYLNVTSSVDLQTKNGFVVTYLPNTTGVSVYEPSSSNTMKCNLTTVNTIIGNMISDGDYYYITKDYSEYNLLDIVLSNGEEEHRILYNRRTRDYLCLSNPFLKNYVPMTYIHE